MIDVIVESNWVFDYCAPLHRRKGGASATLNLVTQGTARLHVPAVCLREGAESVRKKCQPRPGDLREFRKSARAEGKIRAVENPLNLRRIPEVSQMRPFDEAILAAVLVKAETLRVRGASDVRFFTLDTDLWPWAAKTRLNRPGLWRLYADAGVSVTSDFGLSCVPPVPGA